MLLLSFHPPQAISAAFLLCLSWTATTTAFTITPPQHHHRVVLFADPSIGVFFGTSTGNTESAAELISEQFQGDASEPIDIDDIQGNLVEEFGKYQALIVGTPTWNTGADTERSGTGWDEVYYGDEFQSLSSYLKDKPVAVFGCGDSASYAENYCDGMGEIYDVFTEQGANTKFGHVPATDGSYEHEASKAQRGDFFCGLALDMVNFEELTAERVENWVAQLKEEGILEVGSNSGGEEQELSSSSGVGVGGASVTAASKTGNDEELLIAQLEKENEELRQQLLSYEQQQKQSSQAVVITANDGYTPHYNPVTGGTMWTSPDGRKCYYTNHPDSKASP